MLCPYCEEAMTKGFVKVQNESLEFFCAREETGWQRHYSSPEIITIAPRKFLEGARTDAFYCRSCQKVIIDIVGPAKA